MQQALSCHCFLIAGRKLQIDQVVQSRQSPLLPRVSFKKGAPALRARKPLAGRSLSRVTSNGTRVYAARWLENSAETSVDVPLEKAWDLWRDREAIPNFMPWIASVTVQPEDPNLSKWLLRTNQFGRDWEFSWLAQDLTPIKHQKIHWRSVPGSTGGSMGGSIDVANRGQIRFYKTSPTACRVKLTISYECPDALAPFGNALTPVVEGILSKDMDRFAKYAVQQ